MGAYQYQFKLDDLPAPALVKKNQYEQIQAAVEEIQAHAITSVVSSDGSLNIQLKAGEAVLSAAGGSDEDAITITLSTPPVWTVPDLKCTPVILTFKGGVLVSMSVQAETIIDTAVAES